MQRILKFKWFRGRNKLNKNFIRARIGRKYRLFGLYNSFKVLNGFSLFVLFHSKLTTEFVAAVDEEQADGVGARRFLVMLGCGCRAFCICLAQEIVDLKQSF